MLPNKPGYILTDEEAAEVIAASFLAPRERMIAAAVAAYDEKHDDIRWALGQITKLDLVTAIVDAVIGVLDAS